MGLRQWMPIVKEVVSWTAGSCVAGTVGLALRNATNMSSLPLGGRIEVSIGTYVIGMVAGTVAQGVVKQQLDSMFPDEQYQYQQAPQGNRNKQY